MRHGNYLKLALDSLTVDTPPAHLVNLTPAVGKLRSITKCTYARGFAASVAIIRFC